MSHSYQKDFLAPPSQFQMDATNPYELLGKRDFAAFATPREREAFLRRAYSQLLIALTAFTSCLFLLCNSIDPQATAESINVSVGVAWLLSCIGMLALSMIARRMMRFVDSKRHQTILLASYVVSATLICWPSIASSHAAGSRFTLALGVLTLSNLIVATSYLYIKPNAQLHRVNPIALGLPTLVSAFALAVTYQPINGFEIILATVLVVLTAFLMVYNTPHILSLYRTDEDIPATLDLATSPWLYLLSLVPVRLFDRTNHEFL